jgi:predicted aldo/keto reductase-like oxidoreductase
MGTGSVGGNKSSNQTRLGMENFVKLARHAYDKGVRFYDMADSYGSQPFVGEAVKNLPRENIILSTKIWTFPDSQPLQEPVRATIDRCRKEAGSDYYDIILMHCMQESGWEQTRKRFMDELSRAKQDGIVKAVGVSCHNYDALAEAAISPWADVIMARINPFQTLMDGTPEQIKSLLEKARNNGKGIIGMKIFGEGRNVSDDERERSIKFAFAEGHVHSITLGLESIAQMDDAVSRVARLTKSL